MKSSQDFKNFHFLQRHFYGSMIKKTIIIIISLFLIITFTGLGYYFYSYTCLISQIEKIKNMSDADFYSTVHIINTPKDGSIKYCFMRFMDSIVFDKIVNKIIPRQDLDLLGEKNYYENLQFYIGQRIKRSETRPFFNKLGLKVLLPTSSLPNNLYWGDIDISNSNKLVSMEIGKKNDRKSDNDLLDVFDVKNAPWGYDNVVVFEYKSKPDYWDETIETLTDVKKVNIGDYSIIGGIYRINKIYRTFVFMNKKGIFTQLVSLGCFSCKPPIYPVDVDTLMTIAKLLE